jgi:hypothetical protein
MTIIEKVESGNPGILNDDKEALIECLKYFCPETWKEVIGDGNFYWLDENSHFKWVSTMVIAPTGLNFIAATELLKEIHKLTPKTK